MNQTAASAERGKLYVFALRVLGSAGRWWPFPLLGGYDLITLEGSPVPRASRWGLGTIAFAWSNFLTLGPIAGPAIRFLLYRPYTLDAAGLSNAIVANIMAFAATLVVCLISTWAAPAALAPAAALAILALLALLLGRLGRSAGAPGWARRRGRAWAALFGVAFLDW